jgi:hypothetical protein
VTTSHAPVGSVLIHGAERHELHSGHLPMLGHPEELATLLTTIAAATT